MLLVTHVPKESGFSKTELKVQAIARRRADTQLMRIPWLKFNKAYEEYPRWHALTLWAHVIIASEGGIPSWLISDLRERCPGFTLPEVLRPEPIDLRLSEWVRNQKFGYAKRQGWLDALTFYGSRHLRSECVWNYWEQCEREWRKHKPKAFPTFDVWWRDAQETKLCEKISYHESRRIVENYLKWKALEWWVRPLLVSHTEMPTHVLSELKQLCASIIGSGNRSTSGGGKEDSEIWRSLRRCCPDHFLSGPRKRGVLKAVLQRARSHPLYARLAFHGMHWSREWLKNRRCAFPSFRQWRQAADSFIHGDQI